MENRLTMGLFEKQHRCLLVVDLYPNISQQYFKISMQLINYLDMNECNHCETRDNNLNPLQLKIFGGRHGKRTKRFGL